MWYWVFRIIIAGILKILFRLKVEGLENLPQKTNFIVAANHVSFLDPFIIGVAIPEKIHFLVLGSIYNVPWARWFMNLTEPLPTLRTSSSSERAIHLLMKNKTVGLFPEGTRSYDGKMREFKRGAALLALKTGRPIVPCAIQGAYEAYRRGRKLPKLKPIKVKFGKPVYLLKEFDEIIDDIFLQEGTLRVKNAVEELLYAGAR